MAYGTEENYTICKMLSKFIVPILSIKHYEIC